MADSSLYFKMYSYCPFGHNRWKSWFFSVQTFNIAWFMIGAYFVVINKIVCPAILSWPCKGLGLLSSSRLTFYVYPRIRYPYNKLVWNDDFFNNVIFVVARKFNIMSLEKKLFGTMLMGEMLFHLMALHMTSFDAM